MVIFVNRSFYGEDRAWKLLGRLRFFREDNKIWYGCWGYLRLWIILGITKLYYNYLLINLIVLGEWKNKILKYNYI